MASFEDVPDLIEAYRLAFAESRGIWETLKSITNRSQSSGDSQLEYLFQWFGETLDAMDLHCEALKKSEGSDWEDTLDRLDKGQLKLSLICHHIEGSERVSFDSLISQKAIAICLYVYGVISFRCFLFVSGIALEKFKDTESGSDMARLIDRLSSLSNKWNWFNTDSCKEGVLDLWSDNISGEDEAEDVMKLLYQWLIGPLSVTRSVITREMDMLRDRVGDLNALACRAKWGDEFCEFLRTLDEFFVLSDTVEFLYTQFFKWHCYTAECLLDLGNCKRARELLDLAKGKLEGMNDKIMVPNWGNNQLIKFHPVGPPLWKQMDMDRVLKGLFKATGQDSYRKDIEENYTQMVNKVKEIWGSDFEKYASDEDSRMCTFDVQLNEIQALVMGERYSEAEQKFKELDPETCRYQGTLRRFLEHLDSRGSPPSLSWESFCAKQNLLLDVSEGLGDSQLTATFLQQYGIIIGHRSLGRLPKQHIWRPLVYGIQIVHESAEAGDPSSLKLWLKEELNLQFPSPPPACVQEVISCLRDPCDVGEHKRELPAMLKACRLLKRSIDIYSDLLHNWTQGFSNEVEWSQLLESQKFVHDTLKSYLLVLYHFCSELLLENHDVITLNQPDPPTNVSDSALQTCTAFMNSALVWVERGRTRSLLSQLGPWYSMTRLGDANYPGSLKDELIKFDKDEEAAMCSINYSCRVACKPRSKPLFVEYVNLGKMYVAFTIEDVGVDDEPFYNISCREAFGFTAEDLENLPDDSEKLQTLSGEDLVDDALKNLPDEDLEKLADPKTVNKLLFVFYEIIPRQQKSNKNCVVAKLHSILEKLYDILIRPFWEKESYHLRDPYAPVIFVPDKMLYRVPFALLRDKKTKKYLFESHTISIAPSLRVLQHCAMRRQDLRSFPLKQECILAVGNPAYVQAEDLLPGTGTELMHLRECFQGRLKKVEAHEATRANFLELVKEASLSEDRHVFAIMHLGVHGLWSENKSHKTGSLWFAPPQTADICTEHPRTSTSELELQESWKETISSDGSERHRSAFGEVGAITRTSTSSASNLAMLPSEDIIGCGFEWRTHLAVLSACNSSRGQEYYDGEVNLPRALMIAGVPAAVVSQWKIDDYASPVLMRILYRRLQCGDGVASALQSAMIHVRKCTDCCKLDITQNIFQWGSFVVWGLPSVTLPEELYHDTGKAHVSDCGKLNTLLESADNIYALDKTAIYDAIFAVERMLSSPCGLESLFVSDVVKAYTLVPLEDIKRVEDFLETNDWLRELDSFRGHMMFAQAMEGSQDKALECIDWIIAYALSLGRSYDEVMLQGYRQERAVIWRLMGEYDMALEEFTALLAFGEDYECLTQMSYLKHLMGDKSGALEYARRAQRMQRPELELELIHSHTLMTLGVRALPDKYRRWLVNVDAPFTRLTKNLVYIVR